MPDNIFHDIAVIGSERGTMRPRKRADVPRTLAARDATRARVAASIVASIAFRSCTDATGDYAVSPFGPPFNGSTKR